MKSLLYFLMMSITSVTICQEFKLDVAFMLNTFKGEKKIRTVNMNSIVTTDKNGVIELKDSNSSITLTFKVEEVELNKVKVDAEILGDTKVIATPSFPIVPLNLKIILDNSSTKIEESEEYSLSLIVSKVDGALSQEK